MTGIVHFALRLAPYAVPAMIYSVIVKIGADIIAALGVFVFGCVAVLLLHLFGTMSLFLKLWSRRSPRAFFRDIKTVLVTAFSTSSSNATLPATLSCAKEVLRISPSTAGFVLPLGATMNMSGTALYEGCVVLFVAQVFGVDLSLAQQLTLLLLSVLIPSPSPEPPRLALVDRRTIDVVRRARGTHWHPHRRRPRPRYVADFRQRRRRPRHRGDRRRKRATRDQQLAESARGSPPAPR